MDGKVVFFVRIGPKGVRDKEMEQDMLSGVIAVPNALDTYHRLLSDIFVPILQKQDTWGKIQEDQTTEFMTGAIKFGNTLAEAVSSLEGGVELKKPDAKFVTTIDLKPAAFNKAASDNKVAGHFEMVLNNWCEQVERLLDQSDSKGTAARKQVKKTSVKIIRW
jgi:dynein heavy chain